MAKNIFLNKAGIAAVIDRMGSIFANLVSPALTGKPTAPTATRETNDTQLATTAFVHNNVDQKADKATTLAGYNISDAYTKAQTDTLISDLPTIKSDIQTNQANIIKNTNGVSSNQANIATNTTNIATNKTNIATNAKNIATNVTDIATNKANIATNATNIATNKTNIAANKTSINTNTSDITALKSGKADKATTAAGYGITDVYTKSEVYNKAEIDVVKSDLDTAKTNITANKTDIATNKSNIEIVTNTANITAGICDTNKKNIATNKTNITTNATNIATNTTDITELKSGKADKATTLSGYGITDGYTKTETDNKINLKADITAIPTKNSQLTNDSSFITNAANDLVNYYLKNDIYTKAEVTNLLGSFKAAIIKIVDVLPTTGETNIIYFVPRSTGGVDGDTYTEYAYISGKFEKIGSTGTVDLTNYYNKGEIDIKLADYVKIADIDAQLVNYAKKTDVDAQLTTELAKKVNIDGTTPMKYLTIGDRKAGSTIGKHSVVEGGDKAYVSGNNTVDISNVASGDYSHAEGGRTTASGIGSHAEGGGTIASGSNSHAEGTGTIASGYCSHAEGSGTIASSETQTAIGEYNIEDVEGNNLLIVGNGTSDTARSNAFVVGIDGSATVSTELKCQGITDSETSRTVSISDIQEALYKGVKTIATTDWTNKQTTVTVSLPTSMKLEGNGVSTFISAAPESCVDYGKFGVYCSAESGSTLTFTCSKVPTVDLNVNILVQYYSIQV